MKYLSGKTSLVLVLFLFSCAFNFQYTQADLTGFVASSTGQMLDETKQGYAGNIVLGRSCDNLGPSFPAWSNWQPTRCQNIDYRVRCECEANKSERPVRYMWWVQFQSRYPERVNLSYDLTEKGTPHPQFQNRWHFSGGTQIKGRRDERGDNWFLLRTPCNGTVTLWLGQLVLGDDDNLEGPFIYPDN